MNSAEGIKKLIPEWDIHETAANATEAWFEKQLGQPVNTKLLIDSLEAGEGFGEERSLSLAQWCESEEQKRVFMSMTNEERLHMISNSGPGNGWVRATPLAWKKWLFKPRLWLVAVRRRLFQKIAPRNSICAACLKARADVKGEHQVGCSKRGSLIMRHDSIRDLLRQELENLGYTVQIERNAGSDDKSRPGDLKILRWKNGRDLYIDCSVINPKRQKWRTLLSEGGMG